MLKKEQDLSNERSAQIGNGNRVEFQEQTEFICILKKNYEITYVSPSLSNYFKKKSDELINKNFLEIIFQNDRLTIEHLLSTLTPDKPVLTFKYRLSNHHKEPVWQKWTFWAVFKDAKALNEFRAIGRDITERRKTEYDLQYTKNRYQSVVEDQMELVCRYLPNYTLTYANEAYCQHFKKKRHLLVGNTILHHLTLEDQRQLFQAIKTATPERPASTRIQLETKDDGSSSWIEWRRRVIFDEAGKVREIQSIGRDITELKKTEEALRSSEEILRKKTEELERKNNALIEILEQIEHQKNQIKSDVITNVDDLLMPILEQMGTKVPKSDINYIILIKRSLENLTSSFGRKITHKILKLSPREIQISNMIKQGLTSKEIACLLNISVHTVGRHRHSIRKKINITNKQKNLNTVLQSI